MRTVSEVIEIARQWVEGNALSVPGFCGAYLAGSVCRLDEEAPFPDHRDLDVFVVVRDTGQVAMSKSKRLFRGVLVDREFHSLRAYRSPEAVLSSPELSPNLVAGRILSDPTGLLSSLRSIVEAHHTDRRWVQARCAYEREMVMEHLARCRPEDSPSDMVEEMVWITLGLTGLIAVAHLEPPTVRGCLALAKRLLSDQDRPELHEAILAAWGSAQLTPIQVESCLQACVSAFDLATRVMRKPSYAIHPDARAYVVDGARELIGGGYHREATFWIVMMHNLSDRVLQRDACAEDRAWSSLGLEWAVGELGLGTAPNRRARLRLLHRVIDEVFDAAEAAAARLPAHASSGTAPTGS